MAPTGGPIFILSTMRAGSTALALVLDAHPNIAIGRETGLGRVAAFLYDGQMPLGTDWYYFPYGAGWFGKYGLSRAEFSARVASFYDQIFQQYAARQSKSRWGEKTPLNAHYAELLAEIWPRAQFIHLVRHPLAVCASLRRWGYPVADTAVYWTRTNEALVAFGARLGPARYYQLTYERLVTESETSLRNLMRFLNEPWSDLLLRHHEIEADKFRNADIEGGEQNRADRPLDPASLDAWQSYLTAGEARVCLRLTKATRLALHYDETPLGQPLPRLPWRSPVRRPWPGVKAAIRSVLLRWLARRLRWVPWEMPTTRFPGPAPVIPERSRGAAGPAGDPSGGTPAGEGRPP